MTDLKNDYLDYLALIAILSASLFGFIYFGSDRQLQMIMIGLGVFFYVLWGVVHHLVRHDFHLKILVEYVVIALLALVLIFSLLGRT